jgi:hypothetical protein
LVHVQALLRPWLPLPIAGSCKALKSVYLF